MRDTDRRLTALEQRAGALTPQAHLSRLSDRAFCDVIEQTAPDVARQIRAALQPFGGLDAGPSSLDVPALRTRRAAWREAAAALHDLRRESPCATRKAV